ncbi:MAG TPA: hypothetical protein VGD57_07265 [Candidatus Dormibacteraeota bacterium]
MPVEQAVGFYRVGLVEAVILLLFFLLAFGSLTLAARQLWSTLTATESLLARLGAAAVLGSIAVGGTSGVIFNLLQPTVFSDLSVGADTARNQAVLGVALALALTVVAVIRIELYNRGRLAPRVNDEDSDWKVEPPEVAGRR